MCGGGVNGNVTSHAFGLFTCLLPLSNNNNNKVKQWPWVFSQERLLSVLTGGYHRFSGFLTQSVLLKMHWIYSARFLKTFFKARAEKIFYSAIVIPLYDTVRKA